MTKTAQMVRDAKKAQKIVNAQHEQARLELKQQLRERVLHEDLLFRAGCHRDAQMMTWGLLTRIDKRDKTDKTADLQKAMTETGKSLCEFLFSKNKEPLCSPLYATLWKTYSKFAYIRNPSFHRSILFDD